jgi:hypothetical protein
MIIYRGPYGNAQLTTHKDCVVLEVNDIQSNKSRSFKPCDTLASGFTAQEIVSFYLTQELPEGFFGELMRTSPKGIELSKIFLKPNCSPPSVGAGG